MLTVHICLWNLFVVASIKPPIQELPRDENSSLRRGNASVTHIDDITARDAVLSYVSTHHCWGLACAREMTIMDITASSAFQVIIVIQINCSRYFAINSGFFVVQLGNLHRKKNCSVDSRALHWPSNRFG